MRQINPWIGLAGLAFGLLLVACLLAGLLTDEQPVDPEEPVSPAPTGEPPVSVPTPRPPTPPVKRDWPRRYAVSGAAGFFVVINQDGSSYMEKPDGSRQQLAEAGSMDQGVRAEAAVTRALERAQQAPAKATVGQLVVCDTGVVDVPMDAVITFVGSDKVVTLNQDGSSTAYYTSGRIEQRDRQTRRPGLNK